ncbi:MAG: malonic semialdehyde reductase [Rhodospirillaceae bacterium]|nr:MAG: malonic semialdehyde reductase [Rhodospirillaceae bacterium]
MNAPLKDRVLSPLNGHVLDQLFREARTFNAWQDRPVSDELLAEAIDLAKMGPTSVNASPMRVVFVRSPEAKAKLKPALMEGNVEKTMSAPVTAIIAHDLTFYEALPKLFPHADARSWFVGNDAFAEITAFRNGTLQGAYLILALRSLGLDSGAMSGFDNALVDQTFFAGTKVTSNFLLNIGYGSQKNLFPRSPRFDFGEIAKIV